MNAYTLHNIRHQPGENFCLQIDKLTVAAGELTALLGDNGAGKSTLIQLLALLEKPQSGTIQLLDAPLRHDAAQRRQIGYVNQYPYMLPGTVEDNIRLAMTLQQFPITQQPDRLASVASTMQISHLLKQEARTLSGGELKRTAIARALSYQPAVLLLDEPFANLDTHQIHTLEDTLRTLRDIGTTVIFSSHDRLRAQALTNQHINLVQGRITHMPLLNVFSGHYHEPLFDTGQLAIHAVSEQLNASHIAIDPSEIIISRQPLTGSSLQNSFQGRLVQIAQEAHAIRLTVDCGETFQAVISQPAFDALSLQLGEIVCISFKATAVTLF